MKIRADDWLVLHRLAQDKSLAERLVMEGRVFLLQERIAVASQLIEETQTLSVREAPRYVSRGGYKLEKAMQEFPISLKDKRCLDIGSSTGGFTDCMLKNGARHVYAVDVGYGLLDYSLRQDERVTVLERTNARRLQLAQIDGEAADFASMDVSFISVKTVLPAVCGCLSAEADLVILVKPQFEAPRQKVGKGGIVRDRAVHAEVLMDVLGFLPSVGLKAGGLTVSPIKGMDGNTEFLLFATRRKDAPDAAIDIETVVENAWN